MTRTPTPSQAEPAGHPPSVAGDCFVWLSFDIAFSVDLELAARLVASAIPEATAEHFRVSAGAFEFRPPPLVFDQPGVQLGVGASRTAPDVQCILHRFGAVSFVYRVPIEGTLADVIRLSDAIGDHRGLRADAERRAGEIIAALRPALSRPGLAAVNEDYAVFHLRQLPAGESPERFVERWACLIAQVLRSEPRELSPQEISDALEARISLTPSDLTIIDWNAALIIGSDGDADAAPTPTDIRAVLELANISLLELRFLDDRLDRTLDTPLEAGSWRFSPGHLLGRPSMPALRRLAELQADAATLFDSVGNSYKLVGDPFLARLFRLASQQLRLEEWDGSVRRRLATAESIYDKLSDYQANRRMEMLEWIIILLILFEIVMAFFV